MCSPHDPKHTSVESRALRFIVLMGFVSLFADITYEGARGITGPYLALLGASPGVVGFVGGLGELVGYGLRLASGYLADRTRDYWLLTALGYGINLLAVPALALAGRWEVAAFFVVAERLGKAIRAPSRDAMLSNASRQIGTGLGFGIHELLDQIGAVTGPLVVAATMFLTGNRYQAGFSVLFVPAVIALVILFISRRLYPDPACLEKTTSKKTKSAGRESAMCESDFDQMEQGPQQRSIAGETLHDHESRGVEPLLLEYMAFTAVSIAGFTHFQLISYHLKVGSIVPDAYIPILFAVAMGVDAVVALPVGWLFDKKGLPILTVLPALTIPIPFLVFTRSYLAAIVGVTLWGAAMGVQETVMRASIAEIVPMGRRGFAYGIFNTVYGAAWFLGSGAMGLLYDISISYAITLAVALELVSLLLILSITRRTLALQKHHKNAS